MQMTQWERWDRGEAAGVDEVIFYPPPLAYLVGLGLALGLGAACLAFAARYGPLWLPGVALGFLAALALATRYTAGSVALRGCDLALRRGLLTVREVTLPVWDAWPEVAQGPLGRLLDCGRVTFRVNSSSASYGESRYQMLTKDERRTTNRARGMVFGSSSLVHPQTGAETARLVTVRVHRVRALLRLLAELRARLLGSADEWALVLIDGYTAQPAVSWASTQAKLSRNSLPSSG